MQELEKMLLELKDTSELMIDLAYSSLLYNNNEIAEEVMLLEAMMDEKGDEIQEMVMEEASQGGDIMRSIVVLRLQMAMEEIADAAASIADVVIRGIPQHPVLQLSLRDSDVVICRAIVLPGSDLVGKTLGEVKLSSISGMFAIAIKRGKKYIFGPDKNTRIEEGDVIIARGPEEGEEYFVDLASGKERLDE
ncbi:MAG: hypothetical protein PWQ88_575 [Candidatus Methanomethylophilaceae archaeon]|jgi:uncharacterized protein with PhoU and TrkA domain|nr:hypothetical protein [Candidatus Methanomethylophilaceae archaeon]MDI3541590.1 hypothetical protein [Candidatus Methanomethylophilaceae archaeon]HIJ00138.1 potassium channel protein [Candidatus Methanomethylophilaceae archaeon]